MFALPHRPVLLKEVLNFLQPERGGYFVDATFGAGGFSTAVLEASEESCVLAVDQDPEVIPYAERLARIFPERFRFQLLNFRQLDHISTEACRGVVFDLGLSSMQLDKPERGFSFQSPHPPDMRMNPKSSNLKAVDFLETASRGSLLRAVGTYGEEPRVQRVVKAILKARGTGTLSNARKLAWLVQEATGFKLHGKTHPATRTFQGIRMAVNDELNALEEALPKAFKLLCPQGVLAVISFHSLEDRIVKRYFNQLLGRPLHHKDNLPAQSRVVHAEALTRKPVRPGSLELKKNPRSRSAKLRAVLKIFEANSTLTQVCHEPHLP